MLIVVEKKEFYEALAKFTNKQREERGTGHIKDTHFKDENGITRACIHTKFKKKTYSIDKVHFNEKSNAN